MTSKVEKQSNNANSSNEQGNNGNWRRVDIDSFRRIFQLKLAEPSKEAVLEAISILEKRDDVRAAEPNYIGEFLITPNDTYISAQWAINNMRLPEAWELSTGASTVRVGLVDSGIGRNHLDLAGRINEGLSRDHSGGGNPWTGTNGHGTHTAGIIGAIGNNCRGVVGTNWNVELVSLKVGDGGPTAVAVAAAITHATNNDIRILSMSLSVNETTAINDAIALFDGVIIAAAGNSGNSSVGYPARLNNPKIVSVGSIDSDNARSSLSCWGKVDVWAPGGGILSTWPTALSGSDSGKSGYRTESGTSMATPYVAGVAALMLAVNPNLTFQQLSSNIINSGSWIDINHPSGFLNLGSTTITVRRLDAYEAVKAIATFDTRVLSDTTIEVHGTFDRQLSGAVTIPEILNGRSVTTIAASAFSGQTGMSQITIPDSVTSVGSKAFENCTNLTSVTLSDNLTNIENSVFKDCVNLVSITMPNNVKNVGSKAFENCISLTNVTLPIYLTSIGSSSFKGCSNLNQIYIPISVTTIGENAFQTTKNIPIYLDGRFYAPSTFDINWNSSGNPVYLNRSLCTHNSSTSIMLDATWHNCLCNHCRTITSTENHSLGAPYIPTTPLYGMSRHYATCTCGLVIQHCLGFLDPGEKIYCFYCGQEMDDGILMNNIELGDIEQYVHVCCNH